MIARIVISFVQLCVLLLLIMSTSVAFVQTRYVSHIASDVQDVSQAKHVIILGAGLNADGTPSAALEDRLTAALDLFRAGKVKRFFLTGDGGASDASYNEITAMQQFLERNGIEKERIATDPQGIRTKVSCDRASLKYGIEKAIIVTQQFHLPRSLYLCNSAGIVATGFIADQRTYTDQAWFLVREFSASLFAFWESQFFTPHR